MFKAYCYLRRLNAVVIFFLGANLGFQYYVGVKVDDVVRLSS
jgi:hypothetical protein